MELKEIFDALTPDNIKSIPLIADAMAIFVEELEENSAISIKIKEIYNNSFDPDDTLIIQESKEELRTAIISIYLSGLYNVITKAQSNVVLNAKLQELGLTDITLSEGATKIISDENFLTNKEFREKIGTQPGVDYAYNLALFLQSVENGTELTLEEIKLFHFKTEGSIIKEMYENVVKPLSHPIGFTYYYTQVVEQIINDLYGITITYDVRSVEIRGLNGLIDIFTPDSDDTNVKAEVLTRINPLTHELFTEAEYYAQITVWLDKVVEFFSDSVENGRNLRQILFTDQTYIERYTDPVTILYTTYQSWLDGTNIPIKEYDGHYSVYADYDTGYEFQYTDEISFEVETTLPADDYNMNDIDNIDDESVFSIWTDLGFYLTSDEYTPALELQFAGATELDSRIDFTRSTTGTYFDSFGVLQTAPENVATQSNTFDHVDWQKTRIGVAASGTHWILTEDSTVSASHLVNDNFTSPVPEDTIVSYSVEMKSSGRTQGTIRTTNYSGSGMTSYVNLLTGATVSEDPDHTLTSEYLGGGWYRFNVSFDSGNTSQTEIQLLFGPASGGSQTYTGTGIESCFARDVQLELGSVATPRIKTTNIANSAARFTHSYDTRTNHIRNNTMVGAVAGTPGTAPTNWTTITATTTQEIVASGILDGIEYVDIKFSGTPNGTLYIRPEIAGYIAALQSEIWTSSFYISVVAGDMTNIASVKQRQIEYTAGLGYLSENAGVDIKAALTASLQRFSFTNTLDEATTAYVGPAVSIGWDGSGAIDITLRIGLPQMEEASAATALIETSGAAVTVGEWNALGLMVEGAATNLALQSEDLDTSHTLVNGATGTAITAPDGTTTMALFDGDGVGSAYFKQNPEIVVTDDVSVTASIFSKYSDNQWVAIRFFDVTSTPIVYFDILNGVVGTETGATGTITDTGNGIYRLSATVTSTTTTVEARYYLVVSDGTIGTVASGKGAYFWGEQVEDNKATASSYIATTTVAVTRAADVPTITGTNFSDLYNQSEGAFVVEGQTSDISNVNRLLTATDGGGNDLVGFQNTANPNFGFRVRTGASDTAFPLANVLTVNTAFKAAGGYKVNDVACYVDGILVGVLDTSAAMPTGLDRLNIGHLNGANHWQGTIASIAYYDERLLDADLEILTSDDIIEYYLNSTDIFYLTTGGAGIYLNSDDGEYLSSNDGEYTTGSKS